MNKRLFLKRVGITLVLPILRSLLPTSVQAKVAPTSAPFRRVRPTDSTWPSAASWEKLNQQVGGQLIKGQSPFAVCHSADSSSCKELFKEPKNPYFINANANITQTSGWIDAWMSEPSAYIVAAKKTEDVVVAVNFARQNELRLVVRGGGHSYQGTSNAADSLMIWTREMNSITLHDAFVGQGCAGKQAPQPAVTVGSGAIWMHTYNAVTTQAGRYVQGGGCATVGVAGLIQSGGFGSFSKNFGTGAAGLLEAEIVTADGVVRIANACTNSEKKIDGCNSSSIWVSGNCDRKFRVSLHNPI